MNFYMLAKIAPTADIDISQTAGIIISGLSVVFLVLLLLVGFVSLFGSFFKKDKKEPPAKQAPPPKQEIKKAVPVPATPTAETDDNDEIIAVISAVVAQMSIQDGKQYKIKSVKAKNQKSSGRPVWASEGLRQNTNPF